MKQFGIILTTAVVTACIVIVILFLLMPVLGPTFLMPMLTSGPMAELHNQQMAAMHGDSSAVPAASNTPSAASDMAATQLSQQKIFKVSYTSEPAIPPLNRIHAWKLHVETADGAPVTDATIKVNGGMPQHGHGLPTQPKVTQNLGNGDYLVEGMRFQMPGWWVVNFAIEANGKQDSVTFNLQLQ